MNGLPWFRLYSNFITDPDIEELSFEDQRHFLFVLCMKCNGLLDKKFASNERRERAIARRLGLSGDAFTYAKQRLVESKLINESWQPRSWEKLQFKSDLSTQRVRKYREKQQVSTMKRRRNVSETAPDTDTELDTESEREEDERLGGASLSFKLNGHDPVKTIFQHWQTTYDHPRAKLSNTRRQLITRRLKDHTPDELRDAISGYKNSTFHMGDNDTGTVYDSIELMLRNEEHIERGSALFASPPAKKKRMTRFEQARRASLASMDDDEGVTDGQ